MKVNLLPQEVINFIAAGEIIERPASIIKELIENSIDSKATIIIIRIQEKEDMEIIVQDNGSGIDPEDLPNIFLQHATSKANTIAEIVNISTLGFRGEALWSIGNISEINVVTGNNNEFYGIVCKNGNLSPVHKNLSGKQGTTITINNIFNNIPVRKKFLRDFKTEHNHMLDVFFQEALAHPSIGFYWYLDDKNLYGYNGTEPVQRLEQITKNESWLINKTLSFNGYTGTLIAALKKGKFFINLNGRPIEDHKIKYFIKKNLSGEGQSLTGCLWLTLDPQDVDVNIHPRKQQVKFKDSATLYQLLKNLTDNPHNPPSGPGHNYLNQGFHGLLKNPPIMDKAQSSSPWSPLTNPLPTMNLAGLTQSLATQSLAVRDGLYPSHTTVVLGNQKFLLMEKNQQIIIIHLNKIEKTKPQSFNSKIINLSPEILSKSQWFHKAAIKFSIISEKTIIVWEIPSQFQGSIDEFFQTLKEKHQENSMESWLQQFFLWDENSIIELVENNPIDDDWPFHHCSWIIDLNKNV